MRVIHSLVIQNKTMKQKNMGKIKNICVFTIFYEKNKGQIIPFFKIVILVDGATFGLFSASQSPSTSLFLLKMFS